MMTPSAGSANRIGFISEKAYTVSEDVPINKIKTFFDKNKPVNAVVVTKDARPVGLVMNIHLNVKLSQRYGFSLFINKPVATMMDRFPMTVHSDKSIEDVAAKAMQRERSRLYDHIIVVKNGLLFGIVSVRTILNSLVESQRERTNILERYAAKLEQEDTSRRIAIQELESSKKMLQLVIDAIPHAVFWKDCSFRYLGCNRTFARDAGIKDTKDILDMEDADLPWTKKEAVLFKKQDRRVMEQGRPELDVHQVQTNAQGEKRFLNTNKIPLYGPDRDVVGILCFYQDITRRLQADNERIRLEKQLAQAQKMEAIGRLAGGVAHDLNNILSGIVNYPELLLMELPEDSKMIKPLKTIQASGERAAAVVQDLLTLARRGVVKKELIDLNGLVYQCLESPELLRLKTEYPQVEIRPDTNALPMYVQGSSVHLMKTVMNLVTNSLEAIEGPGEVTIRTWRQYVDRPVSGYESFHPGDYVGLSVADTGKGICREDIDKVFESFYTKKEMGRSGTGLGMAVVWGTIKDLDGYIDVTSEPGRGTLVTIYLPARKRPFEQVPDDMIQDSLMGNGQTILVVDDMVEQREIASNYLKKLNYHVHTLESGEMAVAYMRENSADLLVLDMIMEPGMDGLETFMKILEINPGQPAIITSGFSESMRVKKAQKLGAGAYLKKPYNFKHLGQAVKTELQKTG